MYKIVNNDIIVGDFKLGEVVRLGDEYCAFIRNNDDIIIMGHYSRGKIDAVEGLLKQMMYYTFNSLLEDL